MFRRRKLSREEKEEVSGLVQDLKEKYSIPPLNLEKLNQIAFDNNIKINIFNWLNTPYSDKKGGEYQIVLPPFCLISNFSHELGHILLNTDSEVRVDYFSQKLRGVHQLLDQAKVIIPAILYGARVKAYFNKNPYLIERHTESLKYLNFPPGLINLIKEDLYILISKDPVTRRNFTEEMVEYHRN